MNAEIPPTGAAGLNREHRADDGEALREDQWEDQRTL